MVAGSGVEYEDKTALTQEEVAKLLEADPPCDHQWVVWQWVEYKIGFRTTEVICPNCGETKTV